MKKKILFLPLFALLLLNPNLSFGSNTGSIVVQVQDSNFNDIVFLEDQGYFLVYQDFSSVPFKRIDSPPANPYTIKDLPLGHQYKVEYYENNIFGGANFVNLQTASENMQITIPVAGGMRIQVLYNDAKPMVNGHVSIQSQDKKQWESALTDSNGYTAQYWFVPPSRVQDYFLANVTIARPISYSSYPINLTPGVSRDIQLTLPWPSIVSNLITVSIYDGTTRLDSTNGNFIVELFNSSGLVDKSSIDNKGNAFFSNLKVDEYNFRVFQTTPDPTKPPLLFGSKDVVINGTQNSFVVHKGDTAEPLQPIRTASQSCECVAFRLDDIQDYYLKNQQEKVMDIFLEKNASLTIGIIGNYLGKDTQLLDYLHTRVQSKNAPIEIANHGWNHEDFSKFNETAQSSLLNMTNQKVLAMFGVKPVTFLTPLNSLDNDTFKAVTENGMRYISSNAGNPNDRPPYPLSGVTLYHFPESAQTSTLTDQGIFVGTTHDYVFQQIQANLDRYGFAVVMVHPQDFALKVNKTYTSDMDWAQLGELRTLIDDIRAAGLKIVTIDNINPDTTKSVDSLGERSVIPEWVKHVALFWEQAQITDKDFTQGIGYLIKQKIIILQNSTSTLSPGVQNPLQVKSNAGLWAYGQIPTENFANGIKSLVENGIIVP